MAERMRTSYGGEVEVPEEVAPIEQELDGEKLVAALADVNPENPPELLHLFQTVEKVRADIKQNPERASLYIPYLLELERLFIHKEPSSSITQETEPSLPALQLSEQEHEETREVLEEELQQGGSRFGAMFSQLPEIPFKSPKPALTQSSPGSVQPAPKSEPETQAPALPSLDQNPEPEVQAKTQAGEHGVTRHSFEAEATQPRPLSDEFIKAAIKGRFEITNGLEVFGVKEYFDRVPADQWDRKYTSESGEVLQYRDQLIDLVKRELRIVALPNVEKEVLQAGRNFMDNLKDQREKFQDYLRGREAKQDLVQNPVPWGYMELRGFNVPDSKGEMTDMLSGGSDVAVANFHIQRQLGGAFIQWSSEQYIQRKLRKDKPELTRRIYLNPRPQDTVETFGAIIHAANEAGLAVKGKVYDRTFDSDFFAAYDKVEQRKTKEFSLRGDGIVLYVGSEDADAFLEIAESVRQERSEAFEGRAMPKMPFELALGLAIGDEPTQEGTSLTKHRSDVLQRVSVRVRNENEPDDVRRIALFRQFWREEAIKENINPDNPAFNLKR